MFHVGGGAVSLTITSAPGEDPTAAATRLSQILGRAGFRGVVMVDPDHR